MFEVKDDERLDDLERNNLKIIQNPSKFCFGIDAVLLSSYIKVKRGEKLCDLCCGNGIIPLLMSAKSEGEVKITAYEKKDGAWGTCVESTAAGRGGRPGKTTRTWTPGCELAPGMGAWYVSGASGTSITWGN